MRFGEGCTNPDFLDLTVTMVGRWDPPGEILDETSEQNVLETVTTKRHRVVHTAYLEQVTEHLMSVYRIHPRGTKWP